MKTVLFIIVLIAMAQAAQFSTNTYIASTGISGECENLCQKVASSITDIINQFVDGFDVFTFLHSLFAILDEVVELPQVCQGDWWEAIIEIVLDALADNLKECGEAVAKCVRTTLEFIQMFLDGSKPPAIVITKKVIEIANQITSAIQVCSNSSVELELSQEYINSCSLAIEQAYEPIMIEYSKGEQMNYFNLSTPLLSVKVACFDSLY